MKRRGMEESWLCKQNEFSATGHYRRSAGRCRVISISNVARKGRLKSCQKGIVQYSSQTMHRIYLPVITTGSNSRHTKSADVSHEKALCRDLMTVNSYPRTPNEYQELQRSRRSQKAVITGWYLVSPIGSSNLITGAYFARQEMCLIVMVVAVRIRCNTGKQLHNYHS